MTDCQMCGEDIMCAGHSDLHDIGKESVYLCRDCAKRVDDHQEKGDGKYVVARCKECGHVRDIKFIKYKKRGRPTGSRNDPVKIAARHNIKPLF